MRGTLVGLLALVCIVATAGIVVTLAPATTASPSVIEPPPGEAESVDMQAVTGDFGALVSASETTLRVDAERIQLEVKVANTDDQAEIDQVIDAFLTRLEDEARLFDTRTAEKATVPRDERLDGRLLVDELLAQQHLAITRIASLDDLEPLIGHRGDTQRIAELYQLSTSPARESLLDAQLDPTTDRVATMRVTNESVMLATVTDGTYHREMRRMDLRSDGDRDTVEHLSVAEEIVIEQYPDTTDTRALSRFADNVYVVERTAPWGVVDAFVDGIYEAVFLERHRHWLTEVTFEDTTSVEGNDLVVEASRTFPSGPMQIAVTDQEGGAVDASVYIRVDGRWTPLGSTGTDGTLWAVEPPDDFDIRVVTRAETVTLSVAGS